MWGKVRGHDRWAQIFDRLVQRNRLAHAYLFCGPAGIGKRMFAEELGKALLCEKRGEKLASCGTCPACLQVAARSHPDFVEVGRPEEKSELPIDIVREICQGYGLKSARGKGRIAIIDDADDLNEESSNCFLKTLEEPPPRSLLILVGESPDQQLATIRSRCQIVNFLPLADEEVRAILTEHDIKEPALLDRLVTFGHGSPGRALALSDESLWEFRRQFLDSLTKPHFNAVGQMRAWASFIGEAGKEPVLHRRRASLMIDLVIEFFRHVLAVQSGTAGSKFAAEDRNLARHVGLAIDVEATLAILDRLLLAAQHIERNVSVGLATEALLDAVSQQLRTEGRERIEK
jgi:DNA polymerase-3 subunit delta'